ncbi:MAG TPA: DUF1559 domain-containing protein [Thermoguttaceae bacterium]|nr:DUF1559 domain-containing protein [Thermoguttaceae bacterium]
MRSTIRTTLLLTLIGIPRALAAQETFDPAARAKTVAPLLDEQTVLVVRLDVQRVKIAALLDEVAQWIPEVRKQTQRIEAEANMVRSAFLEAGGRELYIVASLADMDFRRETIGFFAVPLPDDTDDRAMRLLFGQTPFDAVDRIGGLLVASTGATMERLREMKADPRPELAAALEAAGDTTAQVLLLPPVYSRRVIEEMMPDLPEEIGGGKSTVITRGVRWAALGVDGPPKTSFRLVVQSEDAQTAAALRETWIGILRLIGRIEDVQEELPTFETISKLLVPDLQGSRLTLTLSEENGGVAKLLSALKPPLEKARQQAQSNASKNNLRQIAIAMTAYESVRKSLPPAASYDADGKPLLSWRVHLLPYLEMQELYEQFHLDEPWDSPHNRKLIERVPPVYRSFGSKLEQEGMTPYVAPVGEETVFSGREGTKLEDIKDSHADTILLVEVSDEHTVVWTQPEDLPFDPDQPAKGLGGPFPGGFNATFCDGSARFVRLPQDPGDLRALFTRAGQEKSP